MADDFGDDFLDNIRLLDEKRRTKQPPTPPAPPIPITDRDTEAKRQRRYAEEALAKEAYAVASAHEGTRNHTLNRAAFNMQRFITEGILRDEEVTFLLTDAAVTAGLSFDEIDATLKSAARGAQAKPRDRPAVPPPTTPSITANVVEVTAHTLTGNNTENNTDEQPSHIWGTHEPIDAATYLFDHEDTTTALWGHNERILWAEGEALMIAGGMGLGKTTLAGQLVRAQLGLDIDVLGLPVQPAQRILYLAMDRPRQIRRSMLRQFDFTEREHLHGRLLIRPGPPVADLAVRPTLLAEMAQECGATVIYIDSLKDAAIGLSNDEVGAAYNRARQYALAHGIQVCELHHLIKRNPMGGAPNTVADVYGSNWLTAGAGSVVMLTGDPGDPIVEFRHVKQPHDEVGPWRLLHDTTAGRFTIDHEVDLLALADATGADGLNAHQAAAAVFEREKPTRAQVEKARRRLDKLVTAGLLVRVDGMRGGVDGGVSANYFRPE